MQRFASRWRELRRGSGNRPFQRRLRIEPLEERRLLATFMVGNLNDAGAGSLRQAILDANGMAGADTIEFESVAGTIALTSGEMEITEAVTIDGPGDDVLTIDAQQNSRILNISAVTGDFTIHGLTLTGGRTTGDNVDFYDTTFNGGAIRSLTTGNLTITNSTVSGNSTAGKYAGGGGVHSYGPITLTNSTVSGNHTLGESAGGGGVSSTSGVSLNDSIVSGNHTEGINGSGGGIQSFGDVTLSNSTVGGNHTLGSTAVGGGVFSTGSVTLTISTVRDNHTEGYSATGGGIRANSSVTLTGSTVSGNHTAGEGATGAGVWAYENVTLTNSTVSGNYTTGDYAWGGGSFCYGDLTLTSSTISGNHTAGIFATGAGAFLSQYSALTMSSSILAGNTVVNGGRPDLHMIGSVPPNLHFSLVGNNFGAALLVPAPLGSPDSNGNLIGTPASPIDPLLGPLADNGGSTMTQVPQVGSPATNAGDPAAIAGVDDVPLFDQRGMPLGRVFGGRIDMGAVESQPIPPAVFGDFNSSGVVDAADYTVQRDTLGSTTDLRADGSGNGSIGPEDYAIWKAHFGQILPPLGAGSASVAAEAEFVAPSVELVASDRVASEQELSASNGRVRRLVGAPHFALNRSAAAARQDLALLAWVAAATSAEPDDGSADLYRPSTPSASESLDDRGLGVLDAAFAVFNGQWGAGRRHA